jgi:hypothetical protein
VGRGESFDREQEVGAGWIKRGYVESDIFGGPDASFQEELTFVFDKLIYEKADRGCNQLRSPLGLVSGVATRCDLVISITTVKILILTPSKLRMQASSMGGRKVCLRDNFPTYRLGQGPCVVEARMGMRHQSRAW